MKPVVALVGRPNVGKSTLFNTVTDSRDALVDDQPGVTRDRLYGECKMSGLEAIVVDSGGLDDDGGLVGRMIAGQVDQLLDEADVIVFVVDARDGLTAADEEIGQRLRKRGTRVFVAVNKSEGLQPDMVSAEFQTLGLGQPTAVSAKRGSGISRLLQLALADFDSGEDPEELNDDNARVAIIGRPNVGKSTLINRLCGEERVIVMDMPGTTRDSIEVPLVWKGREYCLLDTAGVRRKSKVDGGLEKFSVIKTIRALESAQVVVLVIDAREGVSDQDASLAGQALQAGRALVIAANKWDGISPEQRITFKRDCDTRLPFIRDFDVVHISAQKGSGLGELMRSVNKAHASSMREFGTGELNRALEKAVESNPPPLTNGRVIKLKYAHQGGKNPPLIIIHGNRLDALSKTYKRYLVNYFRRAFTLHNANVKIEFRVGENPYAKKEKKLIR